MSRAKKEIKKPVNQAKVSPISGVEPPPEHRWKPGESGNPAGRPPAGLAIKEWLNVMQGYSLSEIQAVMNDAATPMNKLAAARVWLHATNQFFTSSGSPVAGGDFDRIMDRTDGKPHQTVKMNVDGSMTHKTDTQDAMSKLLNNPEAFAAAETLAKLIGGPDVRKSD